MKAWGLTLCTKDHKWKSDTVTAVVVPSWIDSGDVVKIAYKKFNLNLGVGLNKVAGKVFRIGHLGNVNEVCFLCRILSYTFTLFSNSVVIVSLENELFTGSCAVLKICD